MNTVTRAPRRVESCFMLLLLCFWLLFLLNLCFSYYASDNDCSLENEAECLCGFYICSYILLSRCFFFCFFAIFTVLLCCFFFAFLLHLLFQGAFSNRISGAFVLLLVHILINPGFHRLCLLKTDLNLAVSLALPLPYQLRV